LRGNKVLRSTISSATINREEGDIPLHRPDGLWFELQHEESGCTTSQTDDQGCHLEEDDWAGWLASTLLTERRRTRGTRKIKRGKGRGREETYPMEIFGSAS
jgi:hypothetical protein